MNKLPLFFLLVGALFIFIGVQSRGPGSVKSAVSTPVSVPSQASSLATPSSAPSTSTTPLRDVQGKQTSQVQVIRIVDGDTIDVQIEGKEEKIRLIGINAPETNECFGKESTQRAGELLNFKNVSLEADQTQGERDKYKRLLRYVFIDGVSFEETMIREGFAKEYTYSTAYKYQSLFKEAQKEAQENKRGLWSDGACSISEQKPTQSNSTTGNYTCDCSKLCSQISTCDEAYYQLNSCGCSKRDSDRDGIPCESLCK